MAATDTGSNSQPDDRTRNEYATLLRNLLKVPLQGTVGDTSETWVESGVVEGIRAFIE